MKAIGKGEGMHDICNLFGAALSRARRELGLTQIELAEKLGTTDRSISDLERGKTNPKLDMLNLPSPRARNASSTFVHRTSNTISSDIKTPLNAVSRLSPPTPL